MHADPLSLASSPFLSPSVPLYAPYLQGTEAIRVKVVISAAARYHF